MKKKYCGNERECDSDGHRVWCTEMSISANDEIGNERNVVIFRFMYKKKLVLK